LKSILSLMSVDLDAPDHTTLSRRGQRLDIKLDVATADMPIHLVVDSSGLSIIGEGEWAAAKHGERGKRGWKKLHLGVDGNGVIVAQVLTDAVADDANDPEALIASPVFVDHVVGTLRPCARACRRPVVPDLVLHGRRATGCIRRLGKQDPKRFKLQSRVLSLPIPGHHCR
jgi:hypothetical protein